jgi:16S rRNA (guanine527-N7)-methyltransferase
MHVTRIAELLDPFLGQANAQRLTPDTLHSISTYIDILLRWNARINLTAIRDPEDIVPRHFGESLFAATHLFPEGDRVGAYSRGAIAKQNAEILDAQRQTPDARPTVADVGSGAGFPGLPLKLWAPHISLTLIESNHKKATFLREVVRALRLTDVNIVNTRAEALTETFDLVMLRAVEDFTSILPTAAALVAPSGRLGILISSSQLPVAQTSLPHFSWATPVPIPLSRSRVLAVATNQQS